MYISFSSRLCDTNLFPSTWSPTQLSLLLWPCLTNCFWIQTSSSVFIFINVMLFLNTEIREVSYHLSPYFSHNFMPLYKCFSPPNIYFLLLQSQSKYPKVVIYTFLFMKFSEVNSTHSMAISLPIVF